LEGTPRKAKGPGLSFVPGLEKCPLVNSLTQERINSISPRAEYSDLEKVFLVTKRGNLKK
jgi:hypothetical protein